jgi:hypothetical protein
MGARRNLDLGKEYVNLKLVTAAIIEAAAEITGGDAPMVLFMGENAKSRDIRPQWLEDYLDFNLPESDRCDVDPKLYTLLSRGLHESLEFDMKNATTSSYIYERTTKLQRSYIFENLRKYFDRTMTAEEFLRSFDSSLICAILTAAAEIATTRKCKLLELKKHLS